MSSDRFSSSSIDNAKIVVLFQTCKQCERKKQKHVLKNTKLRYFHTHLFGNLIKNN